MNIIFVSGRMSKAKSLSAWQTALVLGGLVLVPVLLTLLFITPQDSLQQQGVKAMLPGQLKNTINSTQLHLDAYAKELGDLQARIMRLDAQNQRLLKLSGDKEAIKASKEANKEAVSVPTSALAPVSTELPPPGSGGPLVNSKHMSEADLDAAITVLSQIVDQHDDDMGRLEAKVLQQSVLKDMLPNGVPVNAAYNSSSYGWRIDPFTGTKAFHEGLDFTANVGTPIRAAADGIVTEAGPSAGYGNMVEVSHGYGLETRYGHASKLLVKAGERVVKGQVIAEVGSTGRSTGPHLHYEIRLNGNALDPRQYLPNSAG
jgi:murein DD-endopeptidase MepM/ murein hydrolase activator NlpD